jgi:hypothetical protein
MELQMEFNFSINSYFCASDSFFYNNNRIKFTFTFSCTGKQFLK